MDVVFVAGHGGLVGAALLRRLQAEGYSRLLVGFNGELRFDPSKPDGTPRKLLDVSRLKSLGWHPRIPLREGVLRSYCWFIEHQDSYRADDRQATSQGWPRTPAASTLRAVAAAGTHLIRP